MAALVAVFLTAFFGERLAVVFLAAFFVAIFWLLVSMCPIRLEAIFPQGNGIRVIAKPTATGLTPTVRAFNQVSGKHVKMSLLENCFQLRGWNAL